MKIRSITVFQCDLPLSAPYYLSGGRLRFDVLDATFVKIETDAGVTGWGEGTPWGHTYVPAHGPGIRAGLETLAPAVLGRDPRLFGQLNHAMDLQLPGHLYAKAPIDMACWDIAGKAAELSISDMLGGRYPDGIPVASSISSGTPEEMLGNIQGYRDRGYFSHSVKVGGDVEADIKRIEHLEANRLPGERLLFDVNRAWTRQQAIRVMEAVSDLGVTVEQPGETLDDIAAIRGLTRIPISIDESLVTPNDATRIARDGIAEVFGIKLNRVGGLTRAAQIRDIGLSYGMDFFVMATGGSVLADVEAGHLAQSIPPERVRSVWACQDMLTVDIASGRGPRPECGVLTVTDAPGLGVEPDEMMLGDPVAVYRAEG